MNDLPTINAPATLYLYHTPSGYQVHWWYSPALFDGKGGYRWEVIAPPSKLSYLPKLSYSRGSASFDEMTREAQKLIDRVNRGEA